MIRSNQAKQAQQHRGFFHTTSPLQKCIKYQKQTLVQHLMDQSRQLAEILNNYIKAHFIQSKSYSEEFEKKKALVVPILIKKCQQRHLQLFSKTLFEYLDLLFNYKNQLIKIQDYNEIASQRQSEIKKYPFIKKTRKINLYKTSQQSILRISLHINKKIKAYNTKKDISIYWNDQITSLTSESLDIFERANQGECSIIILPTFDSFEQVTLLSRQVEVIPFKLFEDKDVFLSLMYKCICDQEIRAYLPKQSLKLITDFDNFPITYTEGAHRLIYCIQRLQALRQMTQKKFSYVDIKPLLKSIQKTLKKSLGFFYKRNQMIEILIQAMLDPSMKVKILDKVLSKKEFFQFLEKNEQTILNVFKKDLFKNIESQVKDRQTANFCFNILNQNTLQIQEWKRNKRINNKQIDYKQYIFFFKTNLESKINKIMKLFTEKIQNEAKCFSWQQFNFVDSIKPVLPHNIYSSLYNNSQFLKEIEEFIMQDQKANASLQKIVQKFSKDRHEAGQLMKMLRQLEQYGLAFFSFEKRKASKKGY